MNRFLSTLVALFAVGASPLAASGASAPDFGRPFEPTPVSQPAYGIKPPSADPGVQRHIIAASDGVDLYVETWLPAAKNGNVPPAKVPTILIVTPYQKQGREGSTSTLEAVVPRGYALSTAHVRGTGESGGCIEDHSRQEVDDAARVVEYLGRDAPWSNGIVGGYGFSYYGGSMFAVAAEGDPDKTKYLKAIAIGAPVASRYDTRAFDGVPQLIEEQVGTAVYAGLSFSPGETSTAGQYVQKPRCWDAHVRQWFIRQPSGDVTDYFREREFRDSAANVRAATLYFHGHADQEVQPLMAAGLFERLTVPKAGFFGVFEHALPHQQEAAPEWRLPRWTDMLVAWYDRYLKELPSGADSWPVAQVQGSDGQWRAEPEWPTTGGPVGHLALGPGGTLGVFSPRASTSYAELDVESSAGHLPGAAAIFETAPLPERLEITGVPVLDVWVSLDRPDAHLAATLEGLDQAGSLIPLTRVWGARSMRHIDPLVQNRFAQERGKRALVNAPTRVALRFNATDLVIPKGGRLRLTIAGSVRSGIGIKEALDYFPASPPNVDPLQIGHPTQPSFAFARVTILHDCEHVSALRFLMPRENPDLLNLREADDPPGPLAAVPVASPPVSDAGGLATAPVCGQAPIRLQDFGREIAYFPTAG